LKEVPFILLSGPLVKEYSQIRGFVRARGLLREEVSIASRGLLVPVNRPVQIGVHEKAHQLRPLDKAEVQIINAVEQNADQFSFLLKGAHRPSSDFMLPQ
jgi:hypothetical protein